MKLEKCSACSGFVPLTVSECPHCQTKRSRLGAVGLVIGSGAIAFTLMACYGAAERPPGPQSPDGAGTGTSTPIATTPDGGK